MRLACYLQSYVNMIMVLNTATFFWQITMEVPRCCADVPVSIGLPPSADRRKAVFYGRSDLSFIKCSTFATLIVKEYLR